MMSSRSVPRIWDLSRGSPVALPEGRGQQPDKPLKESSSEDIVLASCLFMEERDRRELLRGNQD